MLGRRGGDLALAPHISLVVVLLLFCRSALWAGGGEQMINELPRQIPLFPGEWGPAPSRLRLGISLWRSPTRRPAAGGWRQQEADQRFTQWSRASQPEAAPVSSGPCGACARKATHSLVCLSAQMLREGAAPAEKSCWPWPSGAGVRSCLNCFSPLPQVPINGF